DLPEADVAAARRRQHDIACAACYDIGRIEVAVRDGERDVAVRGIHVREIDARLACAEHGDAAGVRDEVADHGCVDVDRAVHRGADAGLRIDGDVGRGNVRGRVVRALDDVFDRVDA